MPATPVFKNILDAAGNAVKMAFRQAGGADLGFRPIHHSEVTIVQATKTRPANTTAYVAGDAVSDASAGGFTFDVGALGIPAGLIVSARLVRDVVTDTGVRFRAYVHDTPGLSAPADKTQYPLLWADRTMRRGMVDFMNPYQGDASSGNNCLDYSGVLSSVQGIPYSAADGILRVGLLTRDAFTPTSGANFLIELGIVA